MYTRGTLTFLVIIGLAAGVMMVPNAWVVEPVSFCLGIATAVFLHALVQTYFRWRFDREQAKREAARSQAYNPTDQ